MRLRPAAVVTRRWRGRRLLLLQLLRSLHLAAVSRRLVMAVHAPMVVLRLLLVRVLELLMMMMLRERLRVLGLLLLLLQVGVLPGLLRDCVVRRRRNGGVRPRRVVPVAVRVLLRMLRVRGCHQIDRMLHIGLRLLLGVRGGRRGPRLLRMLRVPPHPSHRGGTADWRMV